MSNETMNLLQGSLPQIVQEIESIKERNNRVSREKLWEVSRTRHAAIALLMYVCMSVIFSYFGSPSPLRDALVPVLGFVLSTLSLRFIRTIWERHFLS